MKLRTRIAVIAALAVAVAVVAASVGAYFAARDELLDQVDQSLAELARQAQDFDGLRELVTGNAFRRPFDRESGFEVIYVQIFGRSGPAVAPRGQRVVLPMGDDDRSVANRERTALLRDVRIDDEHYRMITAPLTSPFFESGTAIQLARSLREVDGALQGLAVLLTAVSVGGVALAALLGLVVARSALTPIGRLTTAAEHVAETQELAAHIDVDRDDEVGRLAQSFNAMLAALEESRAQQRRLVRDAGHELRTPLTALRTNIEVLNRAESMPPDQRRALLDDVTFELGQLADLVTELVDLATDRSVADVPATAVRLDDVVASVVERFERRTGRTVALDLQPERVSVRRPLIERALSNLLDNAHKFSPQDEPIEVSLRDGTVEVRDHGSGIDEADRDLVFDRFYRAAAARTTPGSGLGLSIVKQVVEDHGGSVFVREAADGGSVVGFRLPGAVVDGAADPRSDSS